jgi:LPXTG-site transpeptidase (sortase) family protein
MPRHGTPHHEHIVVRFKHDWMNQIWERKYVFFAVFMGVLFVSYGVLYALDFYPEYQVATSTAPVVLPATTTVPEKPAPKPVATTTKAAKVHPLPKTLIIDKLDRRVAILNPKTDTVAALDEALLKGIVRHPDSATFAKTGTMFLLGHSSYLPTVNNKNFQALNGIQKLEWGDTIRVQSSDTEYLYRVQKVYEVKASAASADITWGKSKIILVTCNSFGSKDDRFVVEGYLIQSYPIGKPGAATKEAE